MKGWFAPSRLVGALLLAIAFTSASGPVLAERRVALVIGNGAYTQVPPLANAVNDGRAMAEKLRALNFEVYEGIDLDRAAMEGLVREFARGLIGAEVGLFFYAGHGIQVEDENYLIPTNALLQSEADLAFETVRMSDVLNVLNRRVQIRLVFLDACRDNPFAAVLREGMSAGRSASVGRGLARVESGLGSFIAYATEPDAIAADGEGDHSPFTEALLDHIDTPGLELRSMLTRVREDVVRATDGKQVPWDNSSLTREFYFAGSEEQVRDQVAAAPVTGGAETERTGNEAATRANFELAFWNAIKDSNNPAMFEEYLRSFPNGTFAGLAQVKIIELRGRQDAAGDADPPSEVAAPQSPASGAEAPETAEEEQVAALSEETGDPEAELAAAEDALGLSRGERREVQRALAALGYGAGVADGVFGPNSRGAIAAYQDERGDEATGYLTASLYAALMRDAAGPLAALAAEEQRRREAEEEQAWAAEAESLQQQEAALPPPDDDPTAGVSDRAAEIAALETRLQELERALAELQTEAGASQFDGRWTGSVKQTSGGGWGVSPEGAFEMVINDGTIVTRGNINFSIAGDINDSGVFRGRAEVRGGGGSYNTVELEMTFSGRTATGSFLGTGGWGIARYTVTAVKRSGGGTPALIQDYKDDIEETERQLRALRAGE